MCDYYVINMESPHTKTYNNERDLTGYYFKFSDSLQGHFPRVLYLLHGMILSYQYEVMCISNMVSVFSIVYEYYVMSMEGCVSLIYYL